MCGIAFVVVGVGAFLLALLPRDEEGMWIGVTAAIVAGLCVALVWGAHGGRW